MRGPSEGAVDAGTFLGQARAVHYFGLSLEGAVVACNAAASSNLGLPAEQIVGTPIYDFLTEPDAEQLRAELRTPGQREDVCRLNFVDGERLPYTLEVWLDVRADGAVLIGEPPLQDDRRLQRELMKLTQELVVASRERSKSVLQERKARRDAEAASREKDEIVGRVAHELRQPLAAMRFAIEVVASQGEPAARERALRILSRQVGQLARQVEDLLDVSRIRLGLLSLRQAPVDLRDVVADVADAFRSRLAASALEFVVQLPPDPVGVSADRERLTQVFSNLLENAEKFTARGGRIEVVVERDGADAVVSVRDSGRGIAPQTLPVLFELFAQERQGERGGLGIGLAVAHAVVTAHGGTIAAESEGAGLGSRFVIRLPRS